MKMPNVSDRLSLPKDESQGKGDRRNHVAKR